MNFPYASEIHSSLKAEGWNVGPIRSCFIFRVTLTEEDVCDGFPNGLSLACAGGKTTVTPWNIQKDTIFREGCLDLGFESDEYGGIARSFETVEQVSEELTRVRDLILHPNTGTDFEKRLIKTPQYDKEKRFAEDGFPYTKEEFEEYYNGLAEWDIATPVQELEINRSYTKAEFEECYGELRQWNSAYAEPHQIALPCAEPPTDEDGDTISSPTAVAVYSHTAIEADDDGSSSDEEEDNYVN